jgi:2-polyprenyl-3-methyl-5-hydroxy-6-metoxy-1,4-benzoquinol methylase
MTDTAPSCCVCGSRKAKEVWAANLPSKIDACEFSYTGNKKYNGRVVRCLDCGHKYVHPVPADTRNMYAQVEDNYYLNTETERRDTFKSFLDLKERLCPQRGSLLDIGCYTGVFLDAARARHYEAEGIELSRWAGSIARGRGHAVREAAIEDLAGEAPRYDNITAFDVLEHLVDPLKAATIIRSLLRPGGCLAATVPNIEAWHAVLLGRRHWLVVLMHYQYFSRRSLSEMLRRAGFSDVEIVVAPPYRARLKDAVKYAECNPLLKYPFRALSTVRWFREYEIKLKAALFCVARR